MKKTISLLSVLLVVIASIAIGLGIYFTRVSGDWRVFRMAGQNVGSYQSGRVILAEKITNPSSLKRGDAVLYKAELEGRSIDRVGLIYGLPGEKDLGKDYSIGLDENHFLVGQREDRMEIIAKEKIGWKVTRQF